MGGRSSCESTIKKITLERDDLELLVSLLETISNFQGISLSTCDERLERVRSILRDLCYQLGVRELKDFRPPFDDERFKSVESAKAEMAEHMSNYRSDRNEED